MTDVLFTVWRDDGYSAGSQLSPVCDFIDVLLPTVVWRDVDYSSQPAMP